MIWMTMEKVDHFIHQSTNPTNQWGEETIKNKWGRRRRLVVICDKQIGNKKKYDWQQNFWLTIGKYWFSKYYIFYEFVRIKIHIILLIIITCNWPVENNLTLNSQKQKLTKMHHIVQDLCMH